MTQDTGDDVDDVLAELHELLAGGTAADLRGFTARHERHRAAITAFAESWLDAAANGGERPGDANPVPLVGGGPAAVEAFWRRTTGRSGDPFARLGADDLRRIAEASAIDTSILRKLALRMIDEGTVPAALIATVAHAAGTDTATVAAHLDGEPVGARSDYLAPSGPRPGAKISFAAAVRASGLDDEGKRRWLRGRAD